MAIIIEVLQCAQEQAAELGEGAENQSCEEGPRELGGSSLEKSRLRRDLIAP